MPVAAAPLTGADQAPDTLPAARGEALALLIRAAVLLFSGASLLVTREAGHGTGGPAVLWGGVGHLLAAATCVLLAVAVARLGSERAVRRVSMVLVVVDLVAYAAYSALLHEVSGAGTAYGVFVLLHGPVRWGWRGALAAAPLVGGVATAWPQVDAAGQVLAVSEVWVLCLVFAAPAAAISTVVRRWTSRLRQAEGMLASAFEHASTGMAVLDERGHLLRVNAALVGLVGAVPGASDGPAFLAWALPDDRPSVQAALNELSAARRGARAEVRLLHADGTTRWVLLAASWIEGAAGVPPRVLVQVENVTERKAAEEQLTHQASHDDLTGLPNRTLLRQQLDLALQAGDAPAVLFLDLDRFKVVNDGLGHAAGDRLLVEVAGRLQGVLRPGDLVARLGGDEFVVVARHAADQAAALAVADRVLDALRPPVPLGEGHGEVVSASLGVALARTGSTADALLRDADTAMYQAKAAGGSRAAVFTPRMREAAVAAHELEVDLRAALAEGRLTVAYQPSVDLVTGRIEGVEALARWHDDVRGTVSPGEFVPVAEQSDLVCELGTVVLRQALRDLTRWRAQQPAHAPSVSVNVSVRQLTDPVFPDLVARLLEEVGADPAWLCLEVTETALSGDVAAVVAALSALRAVGVRLAIDDFGTGHASLTYLARFPVDVVKVDRSFVAGVGSDAGSAAIVGGVVAMAHTFGLRVVAEGPETQEQLARLRDLGCDQAQGWAYARAMGIEALLALLASGGACLVPAPRHPQESFAPPVRELDENRRYRLLLDGAREIGTCLEVDSVMERAFAVLRRVVDFTGGSVQLVDGDGDGDVVRLAAADPPATPAAMGASIPVGQGVAGGIAADGHPRYLPDITVASTVTAARRRTSTSEGVRSWYGVPLVAEGRVIGVLQVDSVEVDAFDEQDRLLVLSFAPLVAAGVQSARSFSRELGALQPPSR